MLYREDEKNRKMIVARGGFYPTRTQLEKILDSTKVGNAYSIEIDVNGKDFRIIKKIPVELFQAAYQEFQKEES